MLLVVALGFVVGDDLKVGWRFLALAVVIGVCLGFISGFVENPPEASVIENRYFGWPFVWRITKTLLPEEYRFSELFADLVFWVAVVLAVVLLAKILMKG